MFAPTPVPTILLCADDAARRHCLSRLRHEDIQLIAAMDMADAASSQHLAACPSPGVCVIAGTMHGPQDDLAAPVRVLRQAAPMFSLLVISQPPPRVDAHIAGWLSFGSPVDLAAAVRVIASGGWLSDRVPAWEPRRHATQATHAKDAEAQVTFREQLPFAALARLSPRELEVLDLMHECLTNHQIGVRLDISADTVKTHQRHLFKKLDIHDRTIAAVLYERLQAA